MPTKGHRCIRIVIADDHAIFRDGLRRLLQTEPAFKVVGEAANGEEAVRLALQLEPDILLLDLAMPKTPGLQALRQLKKQAARVRTLLLTAAVDKSEALQALQLGAFGVVLKESDPEILLTSIKAVHAGEYWVGRETLSEWARVTKAQDDSFGLTSRELEIVAEIRRGRNNREIALQFSISEETVKRHLSNIYAKLGISSRLELAAFANAHNLE